MDFNKILNTKFNDPVVVSEYLNFISKNKLCDSVNKNNCYFEFHHILPKSIFPEYENTKENIVKLTLYDHFIAHYIIAKTKNPKMLYAFNMMNRAKKYMNAHEIKEAAKLYESLKSSFIEVVRKQALERAPMSLETRAKIGKATKGTVQTLSGRVCKKEYHSNKDKYTHYMENHKHSNKTKQKMSKNGIGGKHAFYNINTNKVKYKHKSFSHPEWRLGNPNAAKIASEKFKGMYHWTNTKTNEQRRSKTSPGKDWIRSRTFNNSFKQNMIGINLKTGVKELHSTIKPIEPYIVVHNKIIVVSESKVYINKNKVLEDLSIPVTDANYNSLVAYLRGREVPKKFLGYNLSAASNLSVVKASDFVYKEHEFVI